MEIFTAAGFTALLQVIAIDLVLAGDNAIVIGLAAAGLPLEQRKKAILVGVIAATVLRIALCGHHGSAFGCCRTAAPLAEFFCFGFAGKCGANCAPLRWTRKKPTRLCLKPTTTRMERLPARAPRKTLAQERCRLSLPTYRCRLTMCWLSQAPPAIIFTVPDIGLDPVDRADGPCCELHRPPAPSAIVGSLSWPSSSSSTWLSI